jgi:hypothetical protein
MPKNWKAEAAKLKTERDFLKVKADEIAFAHVKLKALHRTTCDDLLAANIKIKRARTHLGAAAETFAALNIMNHAESLMLAANELAPASPATKNTDQCGNG